MEGWTAVDLDGTLATYDGWHDGEIGEPIGPMVERVKGWLGEGKEVRIFTARVSPSHGKGEVRKARRRIKEWTREHLGRALEATHEKDADMVAIYDDRAYRVEHNTGRVIGDK